MAIKKYKKFKDIGLVAEEEFIYHSRVDGLLKDIPLRPKLIDLFCGAGGMTLGFTSLNGHRFEPANRLLTLWHEFAVFRDPFRKKFTKN